MTSLLVMSMLALFNFSKVVHSHEIRPAIADVRVGLERIEMDIKLTAEPLVAGIDLEGLEDTDEAPEADVYDALRALPVAEFEARFRQAWPELREGFIVLDEADRSYLLELDAVRTEPRDDLELPRDTSITLSAPLEPGGDMRVGWIEAYGPMVVRQVAPGDTVLQEDAYADFLDEGVLSEPLPRESIAFETGWRVFVRYIGVGFDHIIPKGLDHILFVLGLFLLSLQMRPLITQVTLFTLAHTITLALASLGIVTISPAIVEPLIALSIVYVAVENTMTNRITRWRPFVIFAFGLLHGLGFASVLGEFGLAPGRFVAGLIGFNIGVEVGQLTVIALAYLAVGFWFGKKPWYRSYITVPASIVIGLIGAWWAFERVFL
ncbi:MAG: HupE/UreJ family protein [Pseudomonadota bacterium]